MLILYLILQCRARHKRINGGRGGFRVGGGSGGGGRGGSGGGGGGLLACDSSNSSFLERSTVDFIVPGEMELTTAVRSVSNPGMKCNGNANNAGDNKENSKPDENKSNANNVNASNNAPPAKQPLLPAGTSFPIGQHFALVDPSTGAVIRPLGDHGGSWQQPRMPGFPPVQNGFIPCQIPLNWQQQPGQLRALGPPSYRNPPPPPTSICPSNKPSTGSPCRKLEPTAGGQLPPNCPSCGESNWQHHLLPIQPGQQPQPGGPQAIQYQLATTTGPNGQQQFAYVGFVPAATAQHIKECPRSGVSGGVIVPNRPPPFLPPPPPGATTAGTSKDN